jgi:hypothetical protein
MQAAIDRPLGTHDRPCQRHVSLSPTSYTVWKGGAAYVTRTRDPRITKSRETRLKAYILQCIVRDGGEDLGPVSSTTHTGL